MPLPREHWPISECLGVLFGVLGVDWLLDGRFNPLMALAAAGATGAAILFWRYWQHKKKRQP